MKLYGDALPPMSLVKVWLFFPEALNPYHRQSNRAKKSHLLVEDGQKDSVPPISLVDQWPFLSQSTKGSIDRERHKSDRNDHVESNRRKDESEAAREYIVDEEEYANDDDVSLERVRRLLKDFDVNGKPEDADDENKSQDFTKAGKDHDGNEEDEWHAHSSSQNTISNKKDYDIYRLKTLQNDEHLQYILGVVERARELLKRDNDENDDSKEREETAAHPDVPKKAFAKVSDQPRKANRESSHVEAGLSSASPEEHLPEGKLPKKNEETQPVIRKEAVHSKEFKDQNKEHLGFSEIHLAADSQAQLHTENDKESPDARSQVLQDRGQANKEETQRRERDNEKKHFFQSVLKDDRDLDQNLSADSKPVKQTLTLQFTERVKPENLKTVGNQVQKVLWGANSSQQRILTRAKIDPDDHKKVHFRVQTPQGSSNSGFDPSIVAHKINTDASLRSNISKATGLTLVQAKSSRVNAIRLPKDKNWDEFAIITAIVGGCTLGLIVASVLICSLKRRFSGKLPIELQKKEALKDYEELCRTQMAVNETSPRTTKAINADRQRHGLVDGQGKYTKKTWREEPFGFNMDISTGHVILAYMEDHLKNEDKLSQEWEALCNYKADQEETTAGKDSKNTGKNRYSNVLPYDHTRVKLRETSNVFHSDYINANFITDTDPRNPSYIATQGPLDNTVADFWQMIWEQGVVVIVNLTRLSDMGLPQCHRYWPEEGSEVYNIYQVHLISEHIWCDDYIVRSFYLKHLVTQETRTITQFHFLTWPDLSIPESAKPLLEFRRKVNKCYRGQACPIVVHCNNGVGRTGTYVLIDMVLKKMIKGTKEIDIAATLEHIRDQRPDMVKTKAQFEFCLAAVAEEITAILSSLSN
eukprot:gene14802-5907_t